MVDALRQDTATPYTEDLPTLPSILMELLKASDAQDGTFQTIADVVKRDAAIATKVLALANSAYYSRGHRVDTLDRAFLFLGTKTLNMLAISAAMHNYYGQFDAQEKSIVPQLWIRSLRCAMLAKALATLTSYSDPEDAFISGLMHNIGELILLCKSDGYSQLLHASSNDTHQVALEQERLGLDHTLVGYHAANRLGLKPMIAHAIRFQHATPEQLKESHHLCKLVNVASCMSHEAATSDPNLLNPAYLLFNLNPSLSLAIIEKVNEEVSEMMSALGVSGDQQRAQNSLQERATFIALNNAGTSLYADVTRPNELGQALEQLLPIVLPDCKHLILSVKSHSDNHIVLSGPSLLGAEFKVKRDEVNSALSACVNNKAEAHSENTTAKQEAILDQQMSMLLGSEEIHYLPIASQEQIYFVIAAAFEPEHATSQNDILRHFAHVWSLRCATLENAQSGYDGKAMGDKAREIAHEANNPLSIVTNYITHLSQKLQHDENLVSELNIVREEIARASEIILRLGDLEAAGTTEDAFDINEEIEKLVRLMQSTDSSQTALRFEINLDEGIEAMPSGKRQFRQVITNLLKNASEALEGKGTVFITSESRYVFDGKACQLIEIKDDGPGIPSDILNSLFSPVTSTKGEQHSGLGLSITNNLVKELGGTISCQSSDKGTAFQIVLPKSGESTTRA